MNAAEYFKLAVSSYENGDMESAMLYADRTLEIIGSNGSHILYNDLAIIYKHSGRLWSALSCAARGVANAPPHSVLHATYATLLHEVGRHGDAEQIFARILALKRFRPYWTNYGNLLADMGRYDEAENAHKHALAFDPKSPENNSNLANLYLQTAKYDDAEFFALRCLKENPQFAPAYLTLGILHLLRGELKTGLDLYQWRFRSTGEARHFPWPRWDGSACKRLLVAGEQGYGDEIMCARYLPLLLARGKVTEKVIFACDKSLHRLFEHSEIGFCEIVDTIDEKTDVDCYIDLMDLPRVFDCEIPRPLDLKITRAPLTQFKIGYCIKGSDAHKNDKYRSINPGLFYSYINGNDSFIELSKENMERMFAARDILDTAIIIFGLDLVITVDTMIAHLAGSLGIKTWLLLPANPDWRWRLEKSTTDWYPSIEIFRQGKLGDWNAPLARMANRLMELPL